MNDDNATKYQEAAQVACRAANGLAEILLKHVQEANPDLCAKMADVLDLGGHLEMAFMLGGELVRVNFGVRRPTGELLPVGNFTASARPAMPQ